MKDDSNKNKDRFIQYIKDLDYTLEYNVFNFILNLVLDIPDFHTAIMMFELVFDDILKGINLQTIDVPKESLKCLLKIQTQKLKPDFNPSKV